MRVLLLDLRQEIEWLRSQLGDGATGIADILQSHEEVRQLKEKLNEYEKLMKEMSRSWEERLKRTEERKMEEAEQLKVILDKHSIFEGHFKTLKLSRNVLNTKSK